LSDQPTFTGSESPADIARAAIEWFSRKPNSPSVTIFYENSIPKMKYEFQGGDIDCVCVFRLDKMLESFYSDAERIFAENVRVGFVNSIEQAILLPYIAFSGMTTMLNRLVGLQAELFLETFEETTMLTAGTFLHSLVAQSSRKSSLGRPASKVIQKWINGLVAASIKKKRDFLVGFMNTQPLLNIPTSAGRPTGSTKSEAQTRKDAAEFEQKIEDAIRELYSETGKPPTKTDVARFLKPGVNPKTGTDSRLSVFTKKCKHLKIDFDAIVTRVCGRPKN